MNNSQEIADRIKSTAKSKQITIGLLLSKCDLNKNTLSSMQSGGYLPRIETLTRIADCLECSVDYLLGRVDNVEGEGFTEKEKRLITEYRNKPEMQGAIDRLLDLNDLKVTELKENVGRIAAFGSGPKEISISDDALREANELPDA